MTVFTPDGLGVAKLGNLIFQNRAYTGLSWNDRHHVKSMAEINTPGTALSGPPAGPPRRGNPPDHL